MSIREDVDKKEEKKVPLVIIISSPSGGGKTTIVNKVLELRGNMKRSISYTTRPPRGEEVTGVDYVFVSEEKFRDMLEAEGFLEWEQNFGHYYGTAKEQVEEHLTGGYDVILNIDVKGARQVRTKIPECISIFIMPPSIEELTRRLSKRQTEGAEQREIRIKEAKREMASSDEYDYLVVNKDLDEAVKEVLQIIDEEKISRTNLTQ